MDLEAGAAGGRWGAGADRCAHGKLVAGGGLRQRMRLEQVKTGAGQAAHVRAFTKECVCVYLYVFAGMIRFNDYGLFCSSSGGGGGSSS